MNAWVRFIIRATVGKTRNGICRISHCRALVSTVASGGLGAGSRRVAGNGWIATESSRGRHIIMTIE